MGNLSALPALHATPPPDMAASLERIMAIKSMLQQQQTNQLQQTGLQQENQQRQLQLNDQQAMTAAMKQWDGKDPDELPGLVVKSGGSAQAVMGLRNSIVDYKTKAATLTSQQIKNINDENDIIDGHLEAVKGAPPEAKHDAWSSAIQDLQQKGVIKPGQLPPQYPGDDQITLLEKQHMGQKAILAKAQSESETAKNTAQAAEAQAGQWKPVEGTGMFFNPISNQVKTPAGQVMTPAMMQSKYVAIQQSMKMGQPVSTQDKAFSQAFEKFKTLVPEFNISMASQMTPQSLDQLATQFAQTGQLPSVGYGAAGTVMREKIANRAAELFPNNSLALAKAAYGGTEGALKHIQTQFAQVDSFESTALKNLDQLSDAGKAIPDLGTRFANTPIRLINEKMLGTPEMARFRAALATAQNETAKVLNSANATGVLSDSARGELQQLLSGNLPYPAMQAAINQLKVDMNNRHQSYQEQIDQLKGQVTAPQGAHPAQPQAGSLSVKAPNGKTYNFKTQADADAFKQKAGIR